MLWPGLTVIVTGLRIPLAQFGKSARVGPASAVVTMAAVNSNPTFFSLLHGRDLEPVFHLLPVGNPQICLVGVRPPNDNLSISVSPPAAPWRQAPELH
jgi:hypothetical protein